MQVKIISSKDKNTWYSDSIGEIFRVERINSDTYVVVKNVLLFPTRYVYGLVAKCDCEELYKLDGDVKYKEAKRNTDWRIRRSEFDRERKLFERSSHKMSVEISTYEKLNSQLETKTYHMSEE